MLIHACKASDLLLLLALSELLLHVHGFLETFLKRCVTTGDSTKKL